mmetsp:Transcript_12744/g.29635  ORF Transcript_12744/g.29635 Transcript_12744/m.29635 type:complete len:283 (+) Transcript_12744:98-946(+)
MGTQHLTGKVLLLWIRSVHDRSANDEELLILLGADLLQCPLSLQLGSSVGIHGTDGIVFRVGFALCPIKDIIGAVKDDLLDVLSVNSPFGQTGRSMAIDGHGFLRLSFTPIDPRESTTYAQDVGPHHIQEGLGILIGRSLQIVVDQTMGGTRNGGVGPHTALPELAQGRAQLSRCTNDQNAGLVVGIRDRSESLFDRGCLLVLGRHDEIGWHVPTNGQSRIGVEKIQFVGRIKGALLEIENGRTVLARDKGVSTTWRNVHLSFVGFVELHHGPLQIGRRFFS